VDNTCKCAGSGMWLHAMNCPDTPNEPVRPEETLRWAVAKIQAYEGHREDDLYFNFGMQTAIDLISPR
jgi:hypothetical protein